MIKLLCILGCFSQDTLATQPILPSSQEKSVVFLRSDSTVLKGIKYRHTQGFFCDFEDKINEKRRLNLNLGVGNQ